MKEYEARFPRSTPGLNFIKSPGERCFGTLKQIVQWCVKQRIYTKRELTGDDTWWKQRDQITVITHWDNHCHPLPFTVENGLHYLENQLLYKGVQWPKNLVFYSGSFLTFLTTEIILFYKNTASKGKSCDILVIPPGLICRADQSFFGKTHTSNML